MPFVSLHFEQMKPKVFIKAAMSLDGKIATKTGESQWISNEASRAYVHGLRAAYAAICVGVETVIQDDPRLTIRKDGDETCHIRMILDSKGRIPLASKVLNDAFRAQTIVFTTQRMSLDVETSITQKGAQVIRLKDVDKRVDLNDWLDVCTDLNIPSIYIEGGGEVIAACLKAEIVDTFAVAIAPMIIGGQDAKGIVGGPGIEHLSEAIRLKDPKMRWFGEDLILEYQVVKGNKQ